MRLRASVVAQFKRPHGTLGHLAGVIMAHRASNLARISWTVELLQIQPDHRVLEIGCGPGVALKLCAASLDTGLAIGIDHSQVMIGQAGRRLRREVAAGRVKLHTESLRHADWCDGEFDRIFSINVVQFFPDMERDFALIFRNLSDRGRCATTYQPRDADPSREKALAMAGRVSDTMARAGFDRVSTKELSLGRVPAICVVGEKPAAKPAVDQ